MKGRYVCLHGEEGGGDSHYLALSSIQTALPNALCS